MIYLDNAAGSFPKPPAVVQAVTRFLTEVGASPGRGQHKAAREAGRIVFDTRCALAKLLGVKDPADIFFTSNATEALNLAIMGWVRPGDRVVTTRVEHNSVYRPLAMLAAESGVTVEFANCDSQGFVDVDDWAKKLERGARLAVLTHASNVLGAIQPLEKLVEIAHLAGVPVLVDAAQTAGALELSVQGLGIDMLAFPGHKGLLGPQGTGGLYAGPQYDIKGLKTGGTGVGAKGPQPSTRPEKYESGTYNTPGIAGLGAALEFIEETTLRRIREIEDDNMARLLDGLSRTPGLTIFGPPAGEQRASLVSLSLTGRSAREVAASLDRDYDIYVRAGWLCAAEVHKLIGTDETGVLRLSPGLFSTEEDIDAAVEALAEIGRSA